VKYVLSFPEAFMNKAISLALLAAGVVLAVFGLNESHSFASGVSRVFTGSPTDRAVWLFAGGTLLIVLGVAGLVVSSRSK
jgi:uncharacterized membrane protein YidH (DUF202 family)